MPTEQPEARQPIRLSENCIINSQFVVAGHPLPVASVEELPSNLQALVVTGEPEPEEPGETRGNYDLNTVYRVTDDDRLGKRLQRQAAKLEAAAEEQDWIEEQMDAPLPPEVAEALEAAHGSDIAKQAAQAAAEAERADAISDAVAESLEPPTLYVKRGGRHYAPAHRARTKPGEPVFMREPDGSFEFVGTTDSAGGLPNTPIIT
jgi:hypothetical protein